MSKKIAAIFMTGTILFAISKVALSERDDYQEGDYFWERTQGVAPVKNPTYQEECGSCHFAYQPGLLPARSWQKIMDGLDDHFGDNAELSKETRAKITNYLVKNSADKSNFRRSKKIMRSIGDKATPLRITEIPYIKHEHREIPARLISGNKRVNSLSNCSACHIQVVRGSFSERDISIPGYGKWDD